MKKRHIIDLLFPIALFLVLAVSALFLVILAANVYQKSVAWEESNYANRTCLSYVTEKIRQNDVNGGIEAGTFDGEPCLILRQSFGESTYVTYLYNYDGQLCELFIQEGTSMHAADGQRILEIKDFKVTEQEEGIFRISCTDKDGQETVTYAAVKSRA
ncbi:MAG: DUF4860 domain-containing protein [Lachnospiraceae bacterium]|nr:DUF4860 domain-containing protein [Lachnospiraceae bacterium]